LTSSAAYQDAIPFHHRSVHLPQAAFEFARQGRDPYEMTIAEARQYMDILRLIGDQKKLTFFEVRTAQKLAFPFVCIVFCLVGAAIGSRPQRLSRATGFGLSVAIVFSYYVLSFSTGSLGIVGVLSPHLAAWIPNVVGLGIGIWMLFEFNQG
jgi:lipopolysaccharide export system permease protein